MRKFPLKILLSIFLAAVLLCGCSAGMTTASSKDAAKTIKVGCDTYAPFSFLDADGKPTGIDVELAVEAFRRMGYEPEFVTISWEDKKELVESGEIDCIWSSFTMDGRENEYKWAGPYMKSSQVVAVNPNSDIYTLNDLAGKTIAVQSTTKPEDILRSHDSRIPKLRKVISVQQRDLIFILLSKGYVDALAAHDTSINDFSEETGLKFRILDEPLMTVGLGVAFAKNDTRGLDTELTDTLRQMQQDGTTKRILEKYLADAERYLED